ncbi:3'-5' exonuclease [soil metagenome]
MARALEASGRYRVLRRLERFTRLTPGDVNECRLGLVLDLETTGVDPVRDEIIEFSMLPFHYDDEGRVVAVSEAFSRLRQPGAPISAEITRITSIDDAMVEGQAIDPAEVAAFAEPAVLIIAHNAAFDRRFAERFAPALAFKSWACSMSQIDWKAHGVESSKLAYLAAHCGFFHGGHRAEHDCHATLEILATPIGEAGATGLFQLLERARRPSWRIWAENSPFDLKDVLKARGYRWNGETGPAPRAWYIDVDEADREAEVAFLRAEIYRGEIDPLMRRLTAYERFSDRA